MLENLPQFSRAILKPEVKNEKTIFYPSWHCFCCEDHGLVSKALVIKLIPDFTPSEDKPVMCQNPGCQAFKNHFDNLSTHNFDNRFNPLICQKLDVFNRKEWQNTAKQQQLNITPINKDDLAFF